MLNPERAADDWQPPGGELGAEILQALAARADYHATEADQARAAAAEYAERFRSIFHDSPVANVLFTPELTVLDANEAFSRLVGYPRHELLGAPLSLFTVAADREQQLDRVRSLFAGQPPAVRARVRYRRKDGSVVAARVTLAGPLGGYGDLTCGVAVILDLSEQEEISAREAELTQRLHLTMSTMPDAFVTVAASGHIVELNPAAEQMFGWTAAEAIGRSVFDLAPPEMRSKLSGRFSELFAERHATSWPPQEGVGRKRDGSTFPTELTIVTFPLGTQMQVSLLVRDISERKAVELELANRAVTDELTGLPNRTLMVRRITDAIKRTGVDQPGVAVLFVDLDRLKVINDSLGHSVGDVTLCIIAERIRSVLRDTDVAARFGGDKFVVLREGLSGEQEAVDAATTLLAAVREPLTVSSSQLVIEASIGIAISTDNDVTAEELLRDADLAMHRAKHRGGGCFEVCDDGLRARALSRLRLEGELRHALDEGHVVPYYQPVVDLSGQLVGLEALARWQHPTRGLVPPGEFIPIAEDTGLISVLGFSMLEQVCIQLARWREEHGELADFHVAVNLSRRQLTIPDLANRIAAIASRHGVPMSNIALEITESVLTEDARSAATVLEQLRALGIRLAVDDFGTGYSSLMTLRQFPVTTLKLDRFFVTGVAVDPTDRAIIGSVIDLAHTLGLESIAEGVETEEQREALAGLGCDLAQGFLWSPAVSAHDIDRMLVDRVVHRASSRLAPRANVPVQVRRRTDLSGRIRVVVADDSPGDRNLLRVMLEATDQFEVVAEAPDGPAAIAAVLEHMPDLLLLDLAMPGMDGLTALREIRRLVPDTVPVVLSAFVSAGVVSSAASAGASACLDKNLGNDFLLTQLQECIDDASFMR